MAELYNTSHEHRCIFIHVPKTAGTSIKKEFGFQIGGHWQWYYYAENHPQIWQQYTSFAVVRNPWDRTVSAYRAFQRKVSAYRSYQQQAGESPAKAITPPVDYEVLADASFADFLTALETRPEQLKAMAWHPQTAWLAGPKAPDGRVMVDRVLRFENLDHDFSELCRDLGLATRTLEQRNRSPRSPDYRQYYDDATRRQVARLYAADVEAFEYEY